MPTVVSTLSSWIPDAAVVRRRAAPLAAPLAVALLLALSACNVPSTLRVAPDMAAAAALVGHDAPVATFSIVAFDPETKDLGIAVQSKFLAVGAVVPWAKAGVGAIATQSWANTSFGPKGLAMLREGKSAQETLDALLAADEGRERRQVGIVDAKGRAVTFTGKRCMAHASGIAKANYCVQGNILASREVVEAMAKGFEETKGPLAWRLIQALAAGQKAGGDKRGRQSAALYVVRARGGYSGFNDRYRDLRVDDHAKPIEELARIYRLHERTFGRRRRGRRPRNGEQRRRRGDLDRSGAKGTSGKKKNGR